MKITDHLAAAEKAAVQFIADSSNANKHNYGEMRQYLELAEDINAVRAKAEKLAGESSSDHLHEMDFSNYSETITSARIRKKINYDSSNRIANSFAIRSGLPCYFIFENYLIKIGESSEGSHLYRKNVPLKSAEEALEIISHFAIKEKPFAMRDLLSLSTGPSYRMQITFSALIELGLFKNVGRGTYEFCGASSSPQKWLNMLEKLPIRKDLLEKTQH